MTGTVMAFHGRLGQKSPKLLKLSTREALAEYCQRMRPRGRRNWVEITFDLTNDEAKSVVEARASQQTLDKCWEAGGWELVAEVFAIRLEERLDQYFEREKRRHAEQAARMGALAFESRPRAAARRSDGADLDAFERGRAADGRGRLGSRDASEAE